MSNILTGDFDVVAEFSIPAVNRILAAMHQTERFLHSISTHVDDNPHPGRPPLPVVVSVVDGFGDAIADQRQVGSPNPTAGPSSVSDPIASRLGVILNPAVLGFAQPPITPSHIAGIVQLQLFPPTILSPARAGENLTVQTNVMSRYFPDAGSAPLAEFIRGDLQISAPVNKVATGRVHVLDIDFKADDASINFNPTFSSSPLSPEDIAGISLCIQNGLRTSFLPSSVVLPSSIADVQLRTLPGALALLLDFNDHPSNPSSVSNVLLTGEDGFVIAASRDYILNTLQSVAGNILSQPIPDLTFTVDLSLFGVGTTLHYDYPVKLNSIDFDLSPSGHSGKIVMTIQASVGPEVHGHPFSGPYSPTITAELTLQPFGNTVEIGLGNVSVDPHSTAVDIAEFFIGSITPPVQAALLNALISSNVNSIADQMFNTDTNFANFLNAQFTAPDGTPPTYPQKVFLEYTSADVQQQGIVLHGLLYTQIWPDPHVEFEQISVYHSRPVLQPFGETDYSALKTWIPGGTVTEYDWSWQGQTSPFEVDPNKFVLQQSNQIATGPGAVAYALTGYTPICLTVKGTRISNYGAFYDTVISQVCGVTRFPVGGLVPVTAGTVAAPVFAITRSGPSGEVVVSGYAAAQIDASGNSSPNLIVHFADAQSAAELQFLAQALEQSKRTDAPTAIIAVLAPDQLSKAPFTPGIAYADNPDAWAAAVGLKDAKPPLTLIVTPRGGVAWEQEGAIDAKKLAAALTKHLVKRGPVRVTVPRLNTRIGQSAPNFLFEYTSGRDMPISKLKGQPLLLAFWKTSVKASIQAIRDLQNAKTEAKTTPPMILAINDGDDPASARAVAAESGITATVVADPKREISAAYGVSVWPTIVNVSPSGAVSGIRYGYVAAQRTPVPTGAA